MVWCPLPGCAWGSRPGIAAGGSSIPPLSLRLQQTQWQSRTWGAGDRQLIPHFMVRHEFVNRKSCVQVLALSGACLDNIDDMHLLDVQWSTGTSVPFGHDLPCLSTPCQAHCTNRMHSRYCPCNKPYSHLPWQPPSSRSALAEEPLWPTLALVVAEPRGKWPLH